jgi:hypothetical protein
MSVTMTDVPFLAYRNDAPPRLWATKDVAGTYTGSPQVGWSVPLTGVNFQNVTSLNADFNVNRWNTTAGTWGATVDNGTGVVGTHNINFIGFGAGGINTQGAGTFTGTASGRATLNVSP